MLGIAAGGGIAAETIISWRMMAICQDKMLGEGEGNKVLRKEVAHSKAQTSRRSLRVCGTKSNLVGLLLGWGGEE